ncbi:hypothetical protein RRG08_036466 [Elysia crispata]|uniref:Uncharacterized protein n=1 Tax=Elysia crispata TaxID=231223 RepID=A0AAE1DHL2_9GAST|nr:hypothetical protein RRG08_036466 [Elysia crispata]
MGVLLTSIRLSTIESFVFFGQHFSLVSTLVFSPLRQEVSIEGYYGLVKSLSSVLLRCVFLTQIEKVGEVSKKKTRRVRLRKPLLHHCAGLESRTPSSRGPGHNIVNWMDPSPTKRNNHLSESSQVATPPMMNGTRLFTYRNLDHSGRHTSGTRPAGRWCSRWSSGAWARYLSPTTGNSKHNQEDQDR